jgi:hypothetical protein
MSEQKTEAGGVLVHADKVEDSSLPRSLRHASSGDSLREANELLVFMKDFTWVKENDDFTFEAWAGLRHVLDLVRDKIEIGAGLYKFPFAGDSDDPALVERRED